MRQLVVVGGAAVWLAGCSTFGYTNRVLWRVASPDGSMVGVCQEIPAFDGPGYALRLERPDGSLLRPLYNIGDGDPCSELAWSPDGRLLAVLTAHVARLKFVDAAWAIENPDVKTADWSWRSVSFAGPGQFIYGRGLRFTSRSELTLDLCPYFVPNVRRTGRLACSGPSVAQVVTVPDRIVTGHQVRVSGH
jgi:hypothetical protein